LSSPRPSSAGTARVSGILALALPAVQRTAEDLRRDSCANPAFSARELNWGAPKIHGELLELQFQISERSVARYLRRVRHRGDPAKRWRAFLHNHREVIVAFDFFTVPTVTFQLLYCFFVIEHGRRKILHSNVTQHPTADWVIQQLQRNISGGRAVSLRDSGSRHEVRPGSHPVFEGHGTDTEAHEHPIPKWKPRKDG